MQLPPPQPVSTSHYCVIGDVIIHPHAKIAPGVILQAAPHSKIEVAANAFIGAGVIVQAFEGNVVVNDNAKLEAGVLVLGSVEIGANACIGESTTIINTNVNALQAVPAGSLIGDNSRPASAMSEQPSYSSTVVNVASQSIEVNSYTNPGSSQVTPSYRKSGVIGRSYVTQLLDIMFARNSS